jgi:hypothetical protein
VATVVAAVTLGGAVAVVAAAVTLGAVAMAGAAVTAREAMVRVGAATPDVAVRADVAAKPSEATKQRMARRLLCLPVRCTPASGGFGFGNFTARKDNGCGSALFVSRIALQYGPFQIRFNFPHAFRPAL